MTRVGMMTEMTWEMDEEVNRDKSGEADGMNLVHTTYRHQSSYTFSAVQDARYSYRYGQRWLSACHIGELSTRTHSLPHSECAYTTMKQTCYYQLSYFYGRGYGTSHKRTTEQNNHFVFWFATPFSTSHTTFYWSATVNIGLSCTIFELFDD